MLGAVSSAAATVLFVLVSPLLARVLQPEGQGELAAAQTALALSPVLIAFGAKDSAGWAGDPWRLRTPSHQHLQGVAPILAVMRPSSSRSE